MTTKRWIVEDPNGPYCLKHKTDLYRPISLCSPSGRTIYIGDESKQPSLALALQMANCLNEGDWV